MATPAEVVSSAFTNATNYASSAQTSLSAFTTALNAVAYTAPSLSVTWNSIAAPTLPSLGTVPTMPTIAFSAPTSPTALVLDAPTVAIDSFTEVAPTLTMPTAPTLSYGTVPTIPDVAAITMPTAPTLVMPTAPTFLTLTTPTFAGIDLHQSYLDKLDAIPMLTLVAPTAYSYTPGAAYPSTLLAAIKVKLAQRMEGGTGLPAAAEAAIWDRGRSREARLSAANEAEIMRQSEAFGFHLPTGALAHQLRAAQQDGYDKSSSLSRDIMVKQAEMELENIKQTITQGMDLEGRLIDYSVKLEQMSFESAKAAAENALAIHNAAVEKFKSLLAAYQTYASAYETIIKAELGKIEVFKAQLQGEQAKAQTNETLVKQYQAEIEARQSLVEIYKAQVGAANTLVQIEQTKISAAGEQVKAYVAQANIGTAKLEAYKLGIQAETEKLTTYKIKADVFRTVTDAQAEKARMELGQYTALQQAKAAEWDGYRARVDAERARIQALGAQSGAQLDGFKAGAAATEAAANMHARVFEAEIKNYEAGQQIVLQAGKINNDALAAAKSIQADVAKTGAQVYAQLTSSAYSMIHATAGVSASGGTSVSYNYSGDTVAPASGLVSI